MKIGLICEGITDYITLENILCGFFKGKITDEDIYPLQPALDETDRQQGNFGGWEQVLYYLQSSMFIDAVVNHDYLIIQIDTDICEHKNFSVNPITLAQEHPEQFYQQIKNKLIEKININYPTNFDDYGNKIIFCICIHSLECWLLAFYQPKVPKSPKIVGCENALSRTLAELKISYQKSYKCYDNISRPFLAPKSTHQTCTKSLSFDLFIQQLQQITIS